jgi:uncharacterized surface anchored protein
MKYRRGLFLILTLFFILQFCFPITASAAAPTGDLTGEDEYLVIHEAGGSYPDTGGPSTITVKDPDGHTIAPSGSTYSDIPANSTLALELTFHLADDDGAGGINTYADSNFFIFTLPNGITFDTPTIEESKIYATDSTSGETWLFGTWAFTSDRVIRVDFEPGVASHTAMWSKIGIDGTFDATTVGEDASSTMTLGTQTVTFIRELPPLPEVDINKTGIYDAAKNAITWTVTMTPPDDISLAGYTLLDAYSGNQAYTEDSFYVGTTKISDSDLMFGTNSITYNFPSDTGKGVLVVKYSTTPQTFAAETGAAAATEYSTFTNTATLKAGTETVATDDGTVTVNWLAKTGSLATYNDSLVVLKWMVDIKPSAAGTITGAMLTDTLPAGQQLIEGDHTTYPITVSLDGGTAAEISSGTDAGTYTYTYTDSTSASSLVYRLPAGDGVDGKLTGKARVTYYTRLTDRQTYLDTNAVVSFTNDAEFTWNENPEPSDPPEDYSKIQVVGTGGLISKAAGSNQNFIYPGVIHWTITINRNKISSSAAYIEDTVPSGQRLMIDATHALTVKKGSATEFQATSAAADTNFTSADSFVQKFSYVFVDNPITDTYTVDYYTKIIDTNPASHSDTTGLDRLYANSGTNTVGYTNVVVLKRAEGDISTTGTQGYYSQVLDKTVEKQYNYLDHTMQWKIVVNRNRLPMTNVSVADTVPTGTELLIDATHPFQIYLRGVADPVATAPTSGSTGSTSFSCHLGDISDTYTVYFYTKVTDETLKTRWSGNRSFTNSSELTSNEVTITDTATAQVQNPVVVKTYTYTSGSDTIHWSVAINNGLLALNDATVTDVLNSGLKLDTASVKLYTAGVDALTGAVAAASTGTLVTSGFTVNYDNATNTLSVSLPDGISAYRLEFDTQVIVDDLDYTNTVSLTGKTSSPGGSTQAQNIKINNLWSSGGSGSNGLTVHKEDGAGSAVPGAKYQLFNFNYQPVLRGGNPITAVTDSNGDAAFANLPEWIFYAKEIDEPDGFLINADYFGGSRVSGNVVWDTADDKALGSVEFSKTGEGDSLLTGGTFTLTGTSDLGDEVSLSASAVSGVVSFTSVPLGTYTITETVPPSGYLIAPTTLTAKVEYNSDHTAVAVTVTPDTLLNEAIQKGTIEFTKTDEGGSALAGAQFTLYDSTEKAIATDISDKDGHVRFKELSLGTYTIRETAAPEGYFLSDTVITANVSLKERDTVVELSANTIADKKRAGAVIRITKEDTTSKKKLKGAEFTLYNQSGTALKTAVSGSDGIAEFNDIPAGTYKIVETKAPAEYVAQGASLTVETDYEGVYTFRIENISMDELAQAGSFFDPDLLIWIGLALVVIGAAFVLTQIPRKRKRRT